MSAAPIAGANDPCEVAFEHRNVVRRVHDDPRVTKPYTDADWAAIRALGRADDADLAAHDVRLTLGGHSQYLHVRSSGRHHLGGVAAKPNRVRYRRLQVFGGLALPRQLVRREVDAHADDRIGGLWRGLDHMHRDELRGRMLRQRGRVMKRASRSR